MSTLSSPHLPVPPSIRTVMLRVLLALVPGTAVFTALFGWGVLLNIVVAVVSALIFEAVALKLRGRDLEPLQDGTAIVTGVLLALALPPDAAWWLPVIGSLFAIGLGKHVYGGLGYNPFNPAMVGYVVLLISFPVQMTAWGGPNLPWAADAVSQATVLDHVRTALTQQRTLSEIFTDPGFDHGLLRGWSLMALAYLAGGLWMLWQRTIRWQIPVAMLAGMGAIALVFWGIDSDRYASPLFHWGSGATLLGAFFIATDPVSAATTPRGRLWFGAGIGVLTYVIRTWGGYPDAVAFAVLLMNLCAPTIDRYTPTRVYGTRVRKEQR
ncbi:RnfABCDGE type electron transport complex subunit D [Flagellatimonas centrodinii]|uniref:RnfABCDGE type electron transport complex subunit D n=1 Tax=Flagellatimonas centrodinii TaxID=2806210 RepID=UPI001FEFDB86|nr:RnfABCDGE type electron transport complex subunit D [Flagellatimonas centrodinii]ULQ46992.1 RnfABCDGE type electron transport complex subunit D [Flagellatimonas centrodinii]